MTVRAARLTPPGTGAVATIAIVGDDAWSIISPSFRARSKRSTSMPPAPGSVILGNFGEPPGDEVVLTVRIGTKIPWFEIHCHGGVQVVSWLLEHLDRVGVTIVDWHELEAANCEDDISALALKALPHALTTRTAGILLDQFHGALSNDLKSIITFIEQQQLDAGRVRIGRLLDNAKLGAHLTSPWRVAICGPPNAGKSSLVNALAGYQRAIVTPIPGTTRDVVSTLLAFDGWPVELLDTAGMRSSNDSLEEAGIQLGLKAATNADLVLWVTEPGHHMVPPPALSHVINIFNKCDLFKDEGSKGISISAMTGQGMEELICQMINRLIPFPPQAGEAVPFSETLTTAIIAAHVAASNGDSTRARAVLASLVRPADSA